MKKWFCIYFSCPPRPAKPRLRLGFANVGRAYPLYIHSPDADRKHNKVKLRTSCHDNGGREKAASNASGSINSND